MDEKKATQIFLDAEKIEKDFLKSLVSMWENVQIDLVREIKQLVKGDEDLNALLTKDEKEDYKKQLKKYLKELSKEGLDKKELDLFKLKALKSKIKRIDTLALLIEKELFKAYKEEIESIKEFLGDIYTYVSNETAKALNESVKGIEIKFDAPSKEMINQVINSKKWEYGDFENRLWQQEGAIANNIRAELFRGVVLGLNPKEIGRNIANILKTPIHQAIRIARTEFNYIANQATLDTVKNINSKHEKELFSEYQYLAKLDNRTSLLCTGLNDKKFKIKEAEVGLNYPPMHPNCRSTVLILNKVDDILKDFE